MLFRCAVPYRARQGWLSVRETTPYFWFGRPQFRGVYPCSSVIPDVRRLPSGRCQSWPSDAGPGFRQNNGATQDLTHKIVVALAYFGEMIPCSVALYRIVAAVERPVSACPRFGEASDHPSDRFRATRRPGNRAWQLPADPRIDRAHHLTDLPVNGMTCAGIGNPLLVQGSERTGPSRDCGVVVGVALYRAEQLPGRQQWCFRPAGSPRMNRNVMCTHRVHR